MKYKLKGVQGFDIIKQICETRGVDHNNLQEFLNPNSWVRENPRNYHNMVKSAEIIIDAVKCNKKIGLLVDSDCDGYCSSAMITNYLNEVLGFRDIRFYIHENKEHGLTPFIMNKIKECPPQVLIIPDASSGDYVEHKELHDMGITIVVIDHHEADKYSEFATVVNNQLQEQSNKTLSAGGMVIKLLEMMDILLDKDNSKDYYDLASVALVGDVMLMNNVETRYYVQQGLINVRNPLLDALIRAEGERSYESISFDIAPTINAFIRMGDLKERQDLFLALVGDKSEREITIRGQGEFVLELPEFIAKMASRIKSRQNTAIKKALDSSDTEFVHNLPFTICILDSGVNKSLTGLIGNRIVEKYNKPAIVLRKIDEDFYAGSGRSTATFLDFKTYLNETNYFVFCEGHAGAFGCKIGKDMLDTMKKDLADKSIDNYDNCYLVDKAYDNGANAYDIMAVSELNRYWSRGFDKPLFYIKLNLNSADVDVIGQNRNTIRIKKNGITYIKFKCTPEEIKGLENLTISGAELVGHFSVNEYYNNLYPQVIIENIEFAGIKREEQVNGFGFDFSNINIKW